MTGKRTVPRGFTLLELLISCTIFVIILLALYLVYDTGQVMAVRGETQTVIQQNARVAMETMAREIRMAGYGVPNLSCPGTLPRILEARPTTITFRADLRTATSDLTAAAAAGATTLTVDATTDLAANDILYLTDGTNCESRTIQAVPSATSITLTAGTTNAYAVGSRVYRPKDITFKVTGGQITRDERNPDVAEAVSPPVLADKVPDQNIFTYYDVGDGTDPAGTDITANPVASPDATVRRIRITLRTTDVPAGPNDPRRYDVQSDVQLRNM
jgi:prepilin-type N-terminal cleavage/methylation domain-containing protein